MMKAWLMRGLVIFSFGLVSACQQKPECRARPYFFCEDFEEIYQDIPPDTLSKLKSVSRGDLGSIDPSFGLYIRNRFSLWSENETTRFFRDIGVNHADAMSYVMTVGFVGYLNNEVVDMEALSRELTKPPPPPPPPPSIP